MKYLEGYTDYAGMADELTGNFWSALEDRNDYMDKLVEIEQYKLEMDERSRKLFSDIKGWAGEYTDLNGFNWITLDWYRAMLSELFKMRDALIIMDKFKDTLCESAEWRQALVEMEGAA